MRTQCPNILALIACLIMMLGQSHTQAQAQTQTQTQTQTQGQGQGQAQAPGQTPLQLVTLEYPPYINDINGVPQGPVVDVVNEAFRRVKRPVGINFYPWSRALNMVLRGQADGLFTIKKTAERETTLLYPREPLLSQDYVFFVRKDAGFAFNGDYASIATATIGVVRNTSYGGRFDEAVKQGVFRKLESATDYEHIFRMLIAGRVDMVICSRLVGLSFLRDIDDKNKIVISGPPSETAHSYLVFTRKSDYTALAEEFDRALAAMRKDGALARLLNPIN